MDALPPGFDLSRFPLVPTPGKTSNFVDPPSLHQAHEAAGIVLIVLSSIILTCRLATNLKLVRKLSLDDYLCIVAQVTGITYWILAHFISKWGLSRHAWDIPLTFVTIPFIQLGAAVQIVIAPCLWAAKSAILALYIRVFGTVRWLRLTCLAMIAFMALFYSANIVIACVYCLPRHNERWNALILQRCGTSAWSGVIIGVFSVVADLFILILPFPILRNLHMSTLKKLGLGAVFSTGIVLVALSIASLYLRVTIFKGVDATWNGTLLQIITFGEIFGTVIVACAPAMSAFYFNIVTKSTLWSRVRYSTTQQLSTFRKSDKKGLALSDTTAKSGSEKQLRRSESDLYESAEGV